MIRLKDTQSSAPPGLQQLLRKAQPTRGMTEAEKMRSEARFAQLVTAPAAPAPLLALPKIAGVVVGIGGGAALLANLVTPPSKTEDCTPAAMTRPLEAPARPTDPDESEKGSFRGQPIQENLATTVDRPSVSNTSRQKSIPAPKAARAPIATTNTPTKAQPPMVEVVPSATPGPSSPQNDESYYIGKAANALATSPQDALLHLDEHAKLFPKGMLAEERDFLVIRALVNLKRYSKARERAKQVLREQKNSPYKTRIQELLATIPNNQPD